MASQLHYLTVQDILWINQQITEEVHSYNYGKLEEATYYQYAYGESRDVLKQAARFLYGFPKLHPLEAGNDATSLIGLLAFLQLNGYDITLGDAAAAAWFEFAKQTLNGAEEAIKTIAKPSLHHGHSAEVRSTIADLLKAYPLTLKALI